MPQPQRSHEANPSRPSSETSKPHQAPHTVSCSMISSLDGGESFGATPPASRTPAEKYSILKSMPLKSKRTSLLLLVVTALVCSRALFFFFHDPEGPNLLIVTVLALILYSASFIAWRFIPATTASKKLFFGICTQLLIVTGLYMMA